MNMDEREASQLVRLAIEQLRGGIHPSAELDWFATDVDGYLAVLLNAGHLPVPLEVLQDPAGLIELTKIIAAFAPVSELLPEDPKKYLAKNLFVYDWTGTHEDASEGVYTRIGVPRAPSLLAEVCGSRSLPIYRIDARFHHTERLQVIPSRENH